MSDVVFILGAGASREGGAPVMANFLTVARTLHRQGQVPDAQESFHNVFEGISALGSVYEKAVIDTNNLEDVFAAFEMARLFGRLGPLGSEQIDRLPDDLRVLIVTTLERTLQFNIVKGTDGRMALRAPGAYRGLVDGVFSRPRPSVSFITFNYDLGLDFALHQQGKRIDYGLAGMKNPGGVLVLKLHGSLNWVRCDGCDIATYGLQEYFSQHRIDEFTLSDVSEFRLRVSGHLGDPFHHCGGKKHSVPLIVPPTWSKAEHQRVIGQVWRRAARELSDARIVVVIGYSLPAADHFFRYLWALGTVGKIRIEHLLVIDPSDVVTARFRTMLGPTVVDHAFRPVHNTFRAGLKDINDLLAHAL